MKLYQQRNLQGIAVWLALAACVPFPVDLESAHDVEPGEHLQRMGGGGFDILRSASIWNQISGFLLPGAMAAPLPPAASGAAPMVAAAAPPVTRCGSRCCDVRRFGARPNDNQPDHEAIQAAISQAMRTPHKTVYLPKGRWLVGKSIDMTAGRRGRVRIHGADSVDTVLAWHGTLNHHIFQSQADHDYFKVDIENLRLDGSHLPWASGSGHGVRLAGGWKHGHLHIHRVNIIHPGFYGVGIQTRNARLTPHDIWIKDSFIGATGSDGIDFKAPAGNNHDVHIQNVVFSDIGNSVRGLDASGSGSDAAIDLTAQGFSIYRVTIVTDGQKHFRQTYSSVHHTHITGTNTVEGIRLRRRGGSWRDPAARNGSINRFYIKNTNHGLFFEGWNRNIKVTNGQIKNTKQHAIFLRGRGHEIAASVCAKGTSPLQLSSARGNGNHHNNRISGPTHACVPQGEVGALPRNRNSRGWIDVFAPMDCS